MSYYVHPAKAIIAKTDEFSRLSVFIDDKPTKQNITVAQFAFWNDGKETIRPENLLKPLTIKISDSIPIVDAIVRKKSRDIINIGLDTEKIDKGILTVNWNILEQNDGGIIQIIFLGNFETPILAEGIVEGQGDINEVKYKIKVRSPAEQYEHLCQENRRNAYVFGLLLLFLYILTVALIYVKKKNNRFKKRDLLFFLMPILLTFMVAWLLIETNPPVPPFGF